MRRVLKLQTLGGLVLLLMGSLCWTGCGTPRPKPRAWSLEIQKATTASIQVDLIGVTPLERYAWEDYPINMYWQPGNARRAAERDKLTHAFDVGQASWTVGRTNQIWQTWLQRGVTELLLIADLPGKFEDQAKDARRMFVPLDKNAWRATDWTLQFVVTETRFQTLTPPN